MFWPFKRRERKPIVESPEITHLSLQVSRERTNLYTNLEKLDRVVESHDFDEMVKSTLKLMEHKE